MTTLGPGTRVKCVRGGTWRNCFGQTDEGPQLGLVYTVERVEWRVPEGDIPEGDYIYFRQWRNRAFSAKRFVPLDGNEDISVFTAMLDKLPANHKQPATVGGGL